MNSLMLPKYESCVSVNNEPATSAKGTDSCQENANNKTNSKKKNLARWRGWAAELVNWHENNYGSVTVPRPAAN